jgi:hypothetical protein
MKEVLALACLIHVIRTHHASRALVILIDKILQRQLRIQHTAVLPFFDSNIIEYL